MTYVTADSLAIPGQQSLLFEPGRWPKKPYCSDDKRATKIRSLASALRRPYIQANPPNMRVWSIYDVDRPMAGLSWIDADLPEPSWVAMNRDNGHAHIVWGLSAPVLVDSPDMRQAPLRYLCAVEAAFREALQADQGYAGLLTKNPIHPQWHTLRGQRMAYTLAELCQGLDLPQHLPKKNPGEIGLGRNVECFDWLRKYAYKNIRHYKQEVRNFVIWQQHIYAQALQRNGDFHVPMDHREVWCISKSVAKWTWNRFEIRDRDTDPTWHAKQAARGRRSGASRLAASEAKRATARLMRAQGATQSTIAEALGVSQAAVCGWLRQIINEPESDISPEGVFGHD
jgi:hypothetical protein